MAANYQTVTSYRTVQVLSSTFVQDAEYVLATTLPHNIGFAYTIALDTWQLDRGNELLTEIAALLENLATYDHVVAGVAVQDVDATGLLADAVDLTVRYDRSAQNLPPLDGTVTMDMGQLSLWATDPNIAEAAGGPTPAQTVGQEYARLQAIAGG